MCTHQWNRHKPLNSSQIITQINKRGLCVSVHNGAIIVSPKWEAEAFHTGEHADYCIVRGCLLIFLDGLIPGTQQLPCLPPVESQSPIGLFYMLGGLIQRSNQS